MKPVAGNSVNRTIHYCTWWLTLTTQGKPGVQCRKPVGYTYFRDEDGSKVRSYNDLCDEHQAKADAQPDDDDY